LIGIDILITKEDNIVNDSKRMSHNRVIVCFDIDCFYAQVEEILDPSLKGSPLLVYQQNLAVTTNYGIIVIITSIFTIIIIITIIRINIINIITIIINLEARKLGIEKGMVLLLSLLPLLLPLLLPILLPLLLS